MLQNNYCYTSLLAFLAIIIILLLYSPNVGPTILIHVKLRDMDDGVHNNNNNLLFIQNLLNLNRNSKVRAALFYLQTFSTPILSRHDLIHTLLGTKSLLSVTSGPGAPEAPPFPPPS